MSSIPGLEHLEKEGWEIVRIGSPKAGNWYIDVYGEPVLIDSEWSSKNAVIVRKIEKPKQYRPFANAAEFKPHRDRWVRRSENEGAFLVFDYSEKGFCADDWNPVSWEELFNMGYVFDDDGTPFGVEVTE